MAVTALCLCLCCDCVLYLYRDCVRCLHHAARCFVLNGVLSACVVLCPNWNFRCPRAWWTSTTTPRTLHRRCRSRMCLTNRSARSLGFLSGPRTRTNRSPTTRPGSCGGTVRISTRLSPETCISNLLALTLHRVRFFFCFFWSLIFQRALHTTSLSFSFSLILSISLSFSTLAHQLAHQFAHSLSLFRRL